MYKLSLEPEFASAPLALVGTTEGVAEAETDGGNPVKVGNGFAAKVEEMSGTLSVVPDGVTDPVPIITTDEERMGVGWAENVGVPVVD